MLILRGTAYVSSAQSELLPEFDLALVARLIDNDDQTGAVREFRRLLRA